MRHRKDPRVWSAVFRDLSTSVLGRRQVISGEFAVYVFEVVAGPPACWIGTIERRNAKRMWFGASDVEVRRQVEQDFAAAVHPWRQGYWDHDGWKPGVAPLRPPKPLQRIVDQFRRVSE